MRSACASISLREAFNPVALRKAKITILAFLSVIGLKSMSTLSGKATLPFSILPPFLRTQLLQDFFFFFFFTGEVIHIMKNVSPISLGTFPKGKKMLPSFNHFALRKAKIVYF